MKAITAAELKSILKKKRRHKYNVADKSKRQWAGHTFASKKERDRYHELWRLQRDGWISHLMIQPGFLLPGGVVYKADFAYYDCRSGIPGADRLVVEDCKGFRTEAYRIKRRQVKELYGIDIKET